MLTSRRFAGRADKRFFFSNASNRRCRSCWPNPPFTCGTFANFHVDGNQHVPPTSGGLLVIRPRWARHTFTTTTSLPKTVEAAHVDERKPVTWYNRPRTGDPRTAACPLAAGRSKGRGAGRIFRLHLTHPRRTARPSTIIFRHATAAKDPDEVAAR